MVGAGALRVPEIRPGYTAVARIRQLNSDVPKLQHIAASPFLTNRLRMSDIESGRLSDATSIVFGRKWWEKLGSVQQSAFSKRAKRAGVALNSDSVLGDHFVEVRGAPIGRALATERRESPYRE